MEVVHRNLNLNRERAIIRMPRRPAEFCNRTDEGLYLVEVGLWVAHYTYELAKSAPTTGLREIMEDAHSKMLCILNIHPEDSLEPPPPEAIDSMRGLFVTVAEIIDMALDSHRVRYSPHDFPRQTVLHDISVFDVLDVIYGLEDKKEDE
jgi:hypothetical protein